MKKILPLVVLLLCCITVYAQEGSYTYEEITVDILDDNLHPPQRLRTRKLNKYNKPVYEENYYLCYPTSLTGCNRDSSELQHIVLYEYIKDTLLSEKTTYNVPMQYLHAFDDTTIITYKYDSQGKLIEQFSIHYGMDMWGCTSDGKKGWNDTTNTYHKYDNKGRLTEDLIVRADRPGQQFGGYTPEDKVKYYYDDNGKLSRMEHYNVLSMGTYAFPPAGNIDTVLQFEFTYRYEKDKNIETVINKRNGKTGIVNIITNYADPYRNVLPFYIKTPNRSYTIRTYDNRHKLIQERTYAGLQNELIAEKTY